MDEERIARLKRLAGEYAVRFVKPGMVIGLGGGSTAAFAIRLLGQRLERGELGDLRGVPCSRQVAALARESGIPLTSLNEDRALDLTIDGADEVDPHLNLIKGGGGALLREKIVAQASRREIIVVDETKLSPALGTRFAVPVEVLPFGWRGQVTFLEALGASVSRRRTDDGVGPFETDQGNYILDADFGPIDDPQTLASQLQARAGIVGHGLFLSLVADVVVAGGEGTIRHLRPTAGR